MFNTIDLRSYQRRTNTRESGYHTNNETTGGECYVRQSERLTLSPGETSLTFVRKDFISPELFEAGFGIIAFGGHIKSNKKIEISIKGICTTISGDVTPIEEVCIPIEANFWTGIGTHTEIPVINEVRIKELCIQMSLKCSEYSIVDTTSFNMGAVEKKEYFDNRFYTTFYEKTSLYIPDIYYFDPNLKFNHYLKKTFTITNGDWLTFKSCNRCGRYLPINSANELQVISFSLHCKKRAPCRHRIFMSYEIQNPSECADQPFKKEGNKITSFYGHQLECRVCKKFFVNAPLNPMRDSQQHREDSLRRRALEVLADKLQHKNTVHMEFKRKKKEFTEFIWKRFHKKCFNCGKPLEIADIALDHTMPLAYLYRMDESATCLCSACNSKKSDTFPVDFYTNEQLVELSSITGLSLSTLKSKTININVLNLLTENVVWFFDEFLMIPDYQKIREGRLTADKIYEALKRVIARRVDLVKQYKELTGRLPQSISHT